MNLGETYTVNLPYANCKGIIIGAMTMELGGTVIHFCISFYFFKIVEISGEHRMRKDGLLGDFGVSSETDVGRIHE